MAEIESINSKKDKFEDSSKSKPASNVFNNALQTWTEIDLPSLQKKLDEQGLELKDEQKSSLLSRKNLAAKTKEFKKLPDNEKLEQFKLLLKLYQNEIDSLTNKKKSVENYFFGFYRLLAEAPDPRPLLELSLDAVIDTTDIDHLKREVNRLNEELSKKADYDQLKSRLLRNEQKSSELLSARLHAKEDEYKALIDEKESNWQEKEKSFRNQLKEAQKKIEELRTSKEVTELQLNNQQQNTEPNSSASILAELDIVSRDAETSKKRILELEKRNEELRKELSNSKNDVQIESLKDEYSKKVSEMEGENALLVADLDQTRKKLDDISKENSIKIESFNREIYGLSSEITNLKDKLNSTSDYDEIKHELNLLRQIEFGQDEENEDINDKAIDSILMQRNKALTKELTDYRSQHEEFINKINKLETEVTLANKELIKSQELNAKLENDLADFQDVANSGKFNDNMSLISGISRMTRPGNRNGSVISGISGPSANEDSSILPIITKQRDRFRDRNKELEDELKKQYNTISDLRRQMEDLKKDNEELYERTRYLATFKKTQPAATQSFNSRSNRKLLHPKLTIDLEGNSYQEVYESKLHPIEQFRIREQERISSKLSPLERLFISLTRAILATRTTRMLFMVYCMALHCIVMFITIYAMSLNTSMIPEVGLNTSTGGVANGVSGSPDVIGR